MDIRTALLIGVVVAGCAAPAEQPGPVSAVEDVPDDVLGAGGIGTETHDGDAGERPDAGDTADVDAAPAECPPLEGPTAFSQVAANAADAPVAIAPMSDGGFVALWGRTPTAELVVRRVDRCGIAGAAESAPSLTAEATPPDRRGFDLDRRGDGPMVIAVSVLNWSCEELCEDQRCKKGHLWSWHRHTVTWWAGDRLPGVEPPLATAGFDTEKTNALYDMDVSGCIAMPPIHQHLTDRMTMRIAATAQGQALLLWNDTAAAGSTPGVVMGRRFGADGSLASDLGIVGPAWTYFDLDVDPTSGYLVGFRDGEGVGLLRLDSDGVPRGAPVRVFEANYTDHGRVMVAGLPGSVDRSVLAFGAGLPGDRDVYVATLEGDTLVAAPVRVHLDPEFDQHRPAVAGYADGSFLVWWEEAEWPLVMRRRFDSTGLPISEPEVVGLPGSNPGATSDGERVWAAWLGTKGRLVTPGPLVRP